jgi:sirohydrochlorin ferrochelatase
MSLVVFHETRLNVEKRMTRQALLIVDHGSKRDEANRMLEDVAAVLRRQRPRLVVHYAHMEIATPDIATAFAACVADGAEEIIVHPYMLSPGRHATEDIPRLVQEAATKFPDVAYRVTAPLGLHDKICEVVLERAGL